MPCHSTGTHHRKGHVIITQGEAMKYWIIIDDRHAGPFSAQQLLDTGLTADTLVWFEGIPDWTRAANVAELAEALQRRAMAEADARERLLAEAEQRRMAAEEEARMEAERLRQAQQEAASAFSPAQQPQEPGLDAETEPAQPGSGAAYPSGWQQPCRQQPAATRPIITEPCPPAYIAWSIIATLLCCTIVGIPGIVFASMTKSAYYKGDIVKAKRYSELAQWFTIASIVLGAVSWPFQIAIMGMLQ